MNFALEVIILNGGRDESPPFGRTQFDGQITASALTQTDNYPFREQIKGVRIEEIDSPVRFISAIKSRYGSRASPAESRSFTSTLQFS